MTVSPGKKYGESAPPKPLLRRPWFQLLVLVGLIGLYVGYSVVVVQIAQEQQLQKVQEKRALERARE